MDITKISEARITQIAEELKDRTVDFLYEELCQILFDLDIVDIVEEINDDDILLFNKVLKAYLHPSLTSDLE